jgi:hypothetical protein
VDADNDMEAEAWDVVTLQRASAAYIEEPLISAIVERHRMHCKTC